MTNDPESSRDLYDRLDRDPRAGRVSPTLRLSREALETHLPTAWLRNLRDFLTRSGDWRALPAASVETFAAAPAPGVSTAEPLPAVIGPDEPVFTSLGFGAKGVFDGNVHYSAGVCEALVLSATCGALLCVRHTSPEPQRSARQGELAGRSPPQVPPCLVLDQPVREEEEEEDSVNLAQRRAAPPATSRAATCFDSFCGKNDCLTDNCPSQKCHTQDCDKHLCGTHVCGTKGGFDVASDLWTYADHPFVKELGSYFGSPDIDRLEAAILRYVGRGMFDESTRR